MTICGGSFEVIRAAVDLPGSGPVHPPSTAMRRRDGWTSAICRFERAMRVADQRPDAVGKAAQGVPDVELHNDHPAQTIPLVDAECVQRPKGVVGPGHGLSRTGPAFDGEVSCIDTRTSLPTPQVRGWGPTCDG